MCLDNLVGRYVQHGNRLLRLYNRLVGRSLYTAFLNASWIFSLIGREVVLEWVQDLSDIALLDLPRP